MSKLHSTFETRPLEVVRIDEELEALQKKRKELILENQIACDHKELDIGECSGTSGPYNSSPSVRVCLQCGLTEDGYSFHILKSNNPRQLSRHEVFTLKQGHQAKITREFLLGKVTVQDLIKKG